MRRLMWPVLELLLWLAAILWVVATAVVACCLMRSAVLSVRRLSEGL